MAEDVSNIFEHIVDNMPGLVFQMRFRKDGSWYWNYLSPSGLKMLGLEEDFISNETILKRHSGTDRQKLMDSIRKSVKNLTDWEYEMEFTRSDMTKTWLHCSGKPYVVDDEIALSGVILDIGKKNKTQIRLNESETLYKSLFNNATDSIMLLEGERIVRCNRRTLDFFGCKSESEIIGKTPMDLSPEYQQGGVPSIEIAKKRISSALKGEPQSFEWIHSRNNGEEFSAEINLSVMELNSKQYILALVRDISQRKRIQNELIDLQEYLQLQIERMPIALMVMDTDFRIKSWNPSAERIFGFPESYALGKHPYEFIVPEEIQVDTNEIFERLMKGDDSANLVNKNITRDGRIITCKWSNTPLRKSDGTVVGILSMAEDVSEQKRAEEELKTYQNYLEELVRERTLELEVTAERLDEREKLVSLLSEISSASNLSDKPEIAIYFAIKRISEFAGWPFGHMVYFDEKENTRKLSGIWYADNSLLDSNIESLLKRCSFEPGKCPLNMAVKSRKPILVQHNCACDLMAILVKEEKFKASFVIPLISDDRIIGLIQFFLTDINTFSDKYYDIFEQISIQLGMAIERKRNRDELTLEKDRAEEANRSKSQFLANMSHEIRTPMNSILGFTDILSVRLEDEQNRKYLESIRSSGNSLLKLINDILDLSKVEAGKLNLNLSEIDTRMFFTEILDLFEPKISAKGLELKVYLDKSLPDGIIVDPLRLRQIIINLISNAIKFTDKGYIRFAARAEKNGKNHVNLIVEIEDTGAGISSEFKNKIFSYFQQEDGRDTRRFEGTGLGLPISRGLAKLMNGVISVDSEREKGSIFSLVLKGLEVCDIEIQNQNQSEKKISINSIMFEPCTVLLVEDNVEDREYFTNLLHEAGLSVIVSNNGKEALEILKKESPEIILSDIRMPLTDGYGLIKGVRDLKEFKDIPVVAITASAMKEETERIEKAGFNSKLIKPVARNDFYKKLMDYLPYSKIEDREKRISDLSNNRDISEAARSRLPEVIESLEGIYHKEWLKLRKKQPMEMVREFGEGLKSLGTETEIGLLAEFGHTLLKNIDSFDIQELKENINKYPDLVNTLKKIR